MLFGGKTNISRSPFHSLTMLQEVVRPHTLKPHSLYIVCTPCRSSEPSAAAETNINSSVQVATCSVFSVMRRCTSWSVGDTKSWRVVVSKTLSSLSIHRPYFSPANHGEVTQLSGYVQA